MSNYTMNECMYAYLQGESFEDSKAVHVYGQRIFNNDNESRKINLESDPRNGQTGTLDTNFSLSRIHDGAYMQTSRHTSHVDIVGTLPIYTRTHAHTPPPANTQLRHHHTVDVHRSY